MEPVTTPSAGHHWLHAQVSIGIDEEDNVEEIIFSVNIFP